VQLKIHNEIEKHKRSVIVSHRQLGKTVLAINHIIKKLIIKKKPNCRYFYIAPYRNQAKMIAWDYLLRYTAPIPQCKQDAGELKVSFYNNSFIQIKGADNIDALRGTYADGVIIDEVAQIKNGFTQEIVIPMFVNTDGWLLLTGTPKGENDFKKYYEEALGRMAGGDEDYWAGCFRADESGVISKEKLAKIQETTPANIFRQEYLCDFTASSDNVLIPIDLVCAAQERRYNEYDLSGAPMILGIDPARFGDDRSVIFPRRALQAYEPFICSGIDNMTLASTAANKMEELKADAVFIDAGAGAGVIDRLRQLGYGQKVIEVPFGGRPTAAGLYKNKRAEMWAAARDWLKAGGALPKTDGLTQDLSGANYDYDEAGKLRLESKDRIKERLGRSPDLADALALTFAMPVGGSPRARGKNQKAINELRWEDD
jgi:hypothetical protein